MHLQGHLNPRGEGSAGAVSDTETDILKEKIIVLRSDFESCRMSIHGHHFYGSFGLARFPVDADNTDMLIKLSDVQMYIDKKRQK